MAEHMEYPYGEILGALAKFDVDRAKMLVRDIPPECRALARMAEEQMRFAQRILTIPTAEGMSDRRRSRILTALLTFLDDELIEVYRDRISNAMVSTVRATKK